MPKEKHPQKEIFFRSFEQEMSMFQRHGKASAYNVGDQGLFPGLGRSLEKETVTHSSILAWKIPWTEEPGRLQSMELQRVRHD